jgi:hypothetical protein
MIYVLTAVNAIILGIVAYLFYAFRQAIDSSGLRQIDDYLHELEGSVSQLTEQFERTSTKISKDLLRKTTELQALIGECDTKLAQASRLRATGNFEAGGASARMPSSTAAAPPSPAADREGVEFTPQSPVPAERPAQSLAPPAPAIPTAPPPAERESEPVSYEAPAAEARPETPTQPPAAFEPVGVPNIPAAIAARRMSASELLATKAVEPTAPAHAVSPTPPQAQTAQPAAARQKVAVPAPATPVAAPGSPVERATPPVPADARPPAASAAQPNEKYRLIFLLASEGMDTASIAKHTNLTRGEIEMLLDLRRQGKI